MAAFRKAVPPVVAALAVLATLTFAMPASAATISITLPNPTWATEDGGVVKISGVADSSQSQLVAIAQRSAACPHEPSTEARSDPLVADLSLDTVVSGTFAEERSLIAYARGTICAWLTDGVSSSVTVESVPLAPRFRFPRDSSMPFIVAYPNAGIGLTTFFRKDRITKVVASCDEEHGRAHGAHDRQRFTLARSVRPDPVTGAFKLSGVARPDNSSNYDAPIPKPYHGRAHVKLDARLYTYRTHTNATIEIKGKFTITGRGLRCKVKTVHALGDFQR